MAVFEPKVQCRGDFDNPYSCRDILSDMPASTEMEVFGPRDTPFVKQILPLDVASSKRRLSLAPALAKADDHERRGRQVCS